MTTKLEWKNGGILHSECIEEKKRQNIINNNYENINKNRDIGEAMYCLTISLFISLEFGEVDDEPEGLKY